MKQFIFCLTTILLLGFFSCSKKENTSGLVIRDCTGIYLRFNDVDNRVCDSEVLKNFEDSTTIVFTYKYVEDNTKCNDYGNPVCCMVHGFAIGRWIKIIKITEAN